MVVTDTSLQPNMHRIREALVSPEGRQRLAAALGPRLVRRQDSTPQAFDDNGNLVDIGTVTRAQPPRDLDAYVCHYCGTKQTREAHEPGTLRCTACGGNDLRKVLPPPPPPPRVVPAHSKRRWWQLDVYPFTPDRESHTNSGGPR